MDFSLPLHLDNFWTYPILLLTSFGIFALLLHLYQFKYGALDQELINKKTKQREKKGLKHYPFNYNGIVWMEGVNQFNAQRKFDNFKAINNNITTTAKRNKNGK